VLAHVGLTPASRLAGDWHAPIGVLAAAIIATLLFAHAFVRLRRRGRPDLAPWTRALLFAGGMSLAVLPLVSPLDAVGDGYLLSAHMLQHVLIGDVAPVLLVLAVRGPLVFFLLPTTVLRPLAAFRPLRELLSFVLRPLVSFSLWAAVTLAWHLPSAYDAAIRHPLVHDAEHLSFVLAGTLAWTQLLDPARGERLTRGGKIGFALGMIALGHPVMDVLLFSPSSVYPPYADQRHRVFGLSVLTDQKLAGTVMLVVQLLTLGVFVGVQLAPLLRRRTQARVAAQGRA
jgi:cytochrome c oxidase assembly factor CtaG